MHGVGPGTVIGGRYTTHRRTAQLRAAERWTGRDDALERDVTLLCVPADAPESAAVLDAARRAAGLDNPGLLRVLDIGTWEGVSYVVEEAHDDAHTLGDLVESGGLPAEEVRRITGEVATALDSASQRGLRHLGLTPASVLRLPDGEVKVAGLATEAALAGTDDLGGDDAARRDAVGVVALAYAGLTGRWPLTGDSAGLDHVAAVVGGVPSPSEIAAGVPGDLDALCRLTLNEDAGPLTPGDYAGQVAPWSRTEVGGVSGATMSLPVAGDGDDRTQTLPVAAAPERGRHAGDDGNGHAGEAGTEDGSRERAPRPRHRAAAGTAAAASAVAGRLGSAGSAATQTASHVGGRVGGVARSTADRASQRASERRADREAERAQLEARTVSIADTPFTDEDEPVAPLLRTGAGGPPTRGQRRVVLAVFATFVVVALVAGWWGARQIGAGSDINAVLGPESGRTTSASSASPSSATATSSASSSAGDTSGPVAILSATGYDPEGDGGEHDSEAPRVYDENRSTYWSSEGYTSPELGGIKSGVGVVVDTGQTVRPKSVTLVLPNPEDVTVYLGPDPKKDGAREIGTVSGKTGTVTLDVPAGAKGQYVVVWFTRVSQASDGRYRATLAEVTVTQ